MHQVRTDRGQNKCAPFRSYSNDSAGTAINAARLARRFFLERSRPLHRYARNQQRVNGTGMNTGSSSERPSGHAPGWPFRFAAPPACCHPWQKSKWQRLLADHGFQDCGVLRPGVVAFSRWVSWAFFSGYGDHGTSAQRAALPQRPPALLVQKGATEPRRLARAGGLSGYSRAVIE
jgi:hypothetical protein